MSRRTRFLLLPCLLLLVAAAHGAFIVAAPTPRLMGDEIYYLKSGYQDFDSGERGLLPGTLPFAHRPSLINRVYAALIALPAGPLSFLEKAALFNLLMLLALLAALYRLCLWLPGRRPAGLAAVLLLGTFPWFGFYVHALWPEVPHAAALTAALALAAGYLVTERLPLLFPAGLCAGAALLLKGTANSFLPVAGVYLFLAALRFHRGRPLPARLGRALLPVLLAGAGVAVVIAPQLIVNAREGHGWRLAANRWRNIEWGLRMPAASDPPAARGLTYRDVSRQYKQGGEDFVAREEAARRRSIEFAKTISPRALLARQWEKLRWLVTEAEPLEAPVEESARWGSPPPSWIVRLFSAGRPLWYALLALGGLGLVIVGPRSAAGGLLALYVLYYAAALFVIPAKLRFAMQLVPALCAFAGTVAGPLIARLLPGDPAPYHSRKFKGVKS